MSVQRFKVGESVYVEVTEHRPGLFTVTHGEWSDDAEWEVVGKVRHRADGDGMFAAYNRAGAPLGSSLTLGDAAAVVARGAGLVWGLGSVDLST